MSQTNFPIRVVPCLDISNGKVVKGVNFVDIREMGDPIELAAYYEEEGADELVFLDITATHEQRDTRFDWVEKVARELRIPFCVGGGVRSVEDARRLLDIGVDKVAVNSAALQRPELIAEISEMIGSQSLVVATDVKRNDNGAWDVYTHGGRKNTGRDALDWIAQAELLGAGELLITSMDGDGTLKGFDVELYAKVRAASKLPIIASGGAGTKQHFADVVSQGGADAVLAASLFHTKTLKIKELKSFLKDQNIACRWN